MCVWFWMREARCLLKGDDVNNMENINSRSSDGERERACGR